MPNIRGCEQCELIAFLTNSRFPLESTSTDVLCSEQTLVNQGMGSRRVREKKKKEKRRLYGTRCYGKILPQHFIDPIVCPEMSSLVVPNNMTTIARNWCAKVSSFLSKQFQKRLSEALLVCFIGVMLTFLAVRQAEHSQGLAMHDIIQEFRN